ncbi:MAG TPA: type II toxin-antitoxin system ParD family antitoxin [Pyrinomonadaceae bacterium]|nr:type II toxin-antitoxin system ParD family antitoxin [Pyrinomonadaceae bacterium]
MRKTMNISVSEKMHSFILDRTSAGCYGSASEYIRSLVRRDRTEQQDRLSGHKNYAAPRKANDCIADPKG